MLTLHRLLPHRPGEYTGLAGALWLPAGERGHPLRKGWGHGWPWKLGGRGAAPRSMPGQVPSQVLRSEGWLGADLAPVGIAKPVWGSLEGNPGRPAQGTAEGGRPAKSGAWGP